MGSIGMASAPQPSQIVERKRRQNRNRQAIVWRDQTIAKLLSELKRVRPLNEEEKDLFDRALRHAGPKRSVWRWSAKEDRMLEKLIAKRSRQRRYVSYGKPFQTDTEVLQLAMQLGRTYMAVHRRMERLRKCSDAQKKREG